MKFYFFLGLLLGFCHCRPSYAPDDQMAAKLPDVVDFNFHIKPILSDRCFPCHGPDKNALEGDLRLHLEGDALNKTLSSGQRAFVPFSPRQSEIQTRIAQYEMAYRMQTSIPEVMDVAGEPPHIYDLYGSDSRIPGTYAANCLLARRLVEKGVNFIQLYHRGWDQHFNLPKNLSNQCRDTDQASVALVKDLKQRGLLEDTLVIWGGEFGRTNYSQGKLEMGNYGRDHHPRCFTIWLAGGGIKKGMSFGETDEFGYNIAKDPVHVHDFQATLLHLFGVDHEKLTFKHQGRYYRLTDVHGKVVRDILA